MNNAAAGTAQRRWDAAHRREMAVVFRILSRPPVAVHLVGIGGVGMGGLARLLADRGFRVSGCDAAAGRVVDWLRRGGIAVTIGHAPPHVGPPVAWVIRTPAVRADAPELRAARRRGCPVHARGVVLAALSSAVPSVAVSGTHGKTTTAAMITQVLRAGGRAPSFCIGGEVPALGGVADTGTGPWLVCEADESDGTLALYAPEVAVVTNIELDHLEHFRREADVVDCFRRLVAQTRRRVIYCADDPRAADVGGAAPGSWSYGFGASATFRAAQVRLEPQAVAFDVVRRGRRLGRLRVPVPGRHNVLNALAACAAGCALDVPFARLRAGLAAFGPVRRRFEVVAAGGGVQVISDYAHHPTEVRALISAAQHLGRRRLLAVFQPHRYTRTRALGRDFPPAFLGVDELVLTPVYAASEAALAGGTSADLLRHFKAFGRVRVRGAASLAAAWNHLRGRLRPGDTLLIIGAGDVERMADWAKEFYGGPV